MTDHSFPVVHVFSPTSYHEAQGILGNREGLEWLLKAIQRALENEHTTSNLFTSDGEGYHMHVRCVNDSEIYRAAMPYTADYAEEKRVDAIWPWGKE